MKYNIRMPSYTICENEYYEKMFVNILVGSAGITFDSDDFSCNDNHGAVYVRDKY